MADTKKQTVIYILVTLIISNILWYLGYAGQNSDYAIIFITAASYIPMIMALIITRITKEGWDDLGVAFHFRKSWKIYLVAIFVTVLLAYSTYPLMLLLFGEYVSTTFSVEKIPQICLMMLLGTACFIECLGEELGWIGYLFKRLERENGTVAACILLGIIRGVYHIGILVFMEYPVQMFLEITISNIALSFFMAYMYKKGGTVFPCSIHHGISNMLPIMLVYDNSWYYTSMLPMAVCMIPALIFGYFGFWMMRKEKVIIVKNKCE